MKQSLGLVEIEGLSTAILVADTMAKTANVEIAGIEKAKGFGYITIKVLGDVGAVNAAVKAGAMQGETCNKLVSYKVIPRPADMVEKTFVLNKEESVKKELGKESNENVLEDELEEKQKEQSDDQKLESSKKESPRKRGNTKSPKNEILKDTKSEDTKE